MGAFKDDSEQVAAEFEKDVNLDLSESLRKLEDEHQNLKKNYTNQKSADKRNIKKLEEAMYDALRMTVRQTLLRFESPNGAYEPKIEDTDFVLGGNLDSKLIKKFESHITASIARKGSNIDNYQF